jgi:futalosine hydrolase
MRRILIVTAVEPEAAALAGLPDCVIIAGGVGRTNAAAATTQAILHGGPFQLIISMGIAGSLPGSELNLGDIVIASRCAYAEEGLITADGFGDMRSLGFPLGDFDGNAVPVDDKSLSAIGPLGRIGPIATVATCSGTDAAAAEVVRRTGAIAEAMEGAAVVHAARRLKLPGLEIRAISNTTGERSRQQWEVGGALKTLGEAAKIAIPKLHDLFAE